MTNKPSQMEQNITTEDSHLIVHGYERSAFKSWLVYIFCTIFLGIPCLVFHWYPTWLLYATSRRCRLEQATKVLIVETYQKKCRSFFIHQILQKTIADKDGVRNEGFQEDSGREEVMSPEDLTAPVHFDDGSVTHLSGYRYFVHKKCTLIWDCTRAIFVRLAGIECGTACSELQRMGAVPPSPDARNRMLNIYGLNEIAVPVQSIFALIVLEVFNPFYIFQLFTIAVWLAEPYYYYCVAVVCMSTFGITTSVIQTRRNQKNLQATVESHDTAILFPEQETDSRFIAPGDIVILPSSGCTMHFDAVLLTGSCIVNESMLTGESVPVTKTAVLRIDSPFDLKEHASNTLFCGTKVIQTRFYNNEPVKALVLRTGYNTSKGQLVRSILYPAPADFKFDRDSYKFIFILAIIAMIGLTYTIILKASRDLTIGDIIIKALDIITIVIPPALPAAMTVGRLYAVSRLQKARVYCLNTRAVNVSGSVDCVCFDKTGTLTEDGLDMWGIVPVRHEMSPPALGQPESDPRILNDLDDLKLGMTVCHSLTLLDGKLAGDPLDLKMFESTGWVLEEPAVPDTSKYDLLVPTVVRPPQPRNINVDDMHVPLEVGVVQQNQFVSSLQRSSVVSRVLGENVFRTYCKGSPEMLRTLCLPDTVPRNLDTVLSLYAEQGYRVIALASKTMQLAGIRELEKTTRDQVECDLNFLGLVILENRLKPATTGIIKELKDANIHVVMITGDNIHTAVSVAKECGILASGERLVHMYTTQSRQEKIPAIHCVNTLRGVPIGKVSMLTLNKSIDSGNYSDWASSGSVNNKDQQKSIDSRTDIENGSSSVNYKIAMTGDTWAVLREFYPEMIGRIVARGAVFARMSSDQKQQLIVEYQALGYYTAMCGDGANDCGALRAAHTGISLSELESSVAAPFTSRDPDIVCVARIIREGRAALVTSFGVFKFMVGYSLTQFLSVAFLYYFESNLTDFEFLFIDICLIVNFAFFFGKTEAFNGKLCKIPPLTSLLSFIPLFSLIGQMVIITFMQWMSYFMLTQFPWYERHIPSSSEDYECWENYAIYAISIFQYIALAIVFSHGAPYRKSVITNRPFMISTVIMTCVGAYIIVMPAHWLERFLQLHMPLDRMLSYIILMLGGINLIVALFYERFIVQFLMEERGYIPRFLKEKHVRKTPYLALRSDLSNSDYLNCQTVFRNEPGAGNSGRMDDYNNCNLQHDSTVM